MNEQKTEEMIQAKGLTAPRLSPELIDAVIVDESFTTLPSGKVMVCELTLRNGFTVRGEASVVSKENFREEIGQKVSRDNARQKVWELEGYLLQQKLAETWRVFPSVPRLHPRGRGEALVWAFLGGVLHRYASRVLCRMQEFGHLGNDAWHFWNDVSARSLRRPGHR